MVIFLDTYAIIEIAAGNPSYKQYALNSGDGVATIFNLSEVYFYYLKNFGEKEAEKIYGVVKPLSVPIDDSIIKAAMRFKLAHQKKRYSIADCIGYFTALKLNLKFLTGDYAFKYLENVEFVK